MAYQATLLIDFISFFIEPAQGANGAKELRGDATFFQVSAVAELLKAQILKNDQQLKILIRTNIWNDAKKQKLILRILLVVVV